MGTYGERAERLFLSGYNCAQSSDSQPVEITTFRVDGGYRDGRHPEQVTFTPHLADDLARRDFTVNALAYSPHTGIVDRFDGVGDLRRQAGRAADAAAFRRGKNDR